MIKQLLGTALLCCIITAFFYCLFYKIACKSNINDFEADSPYIGDYASSIIVFLAISSLTLLIVVYFYITISPKLPKFLNDSGFTFAFLQLGAGFFIRLLHKIFFFTIVKITKSTSYHKLTSCHHNMCCSHNTRRPLFLYNTITNTNHLLQPK